MASTPDSENSSCKTKQSEISFATSNKGKPLLIYENYLFRCNKTTAKTKAFRMRFDTLHSRFAKKEINSKELFSGLSLLIGKKKNIILYSQCSLLFFILN